MRLNAVEAGDGAPLVLLHGLFGAASNWGGIQKALAPRHRVIALDLRNHGASGRDPAMDYPRMAADVAETLAALGAAPAAVLGHSMGGKVAMALALTQPGMVARLVVADIAPVTYPPALRPYVAAMQDIPLHPDLTRREADALLADTIPEPNIRAFLLQNLRFGEGAPQWRLGLAEIAAAMPMIEGFPELEARFDAPVLVLDGERSTYVRPAHHARIAALFPHVAYAMVPGAGHWVHAENPKGFLALVEPFLAG
ncbi:alpha/beta fold hydrolase [Paracraurococcus ruber]|uniref:Alpha/beta hydrolase n=1 Tax=Paracraurococcus ruber TaxID=77675 RepID=A0ABS1D5Z0_9PROT|nr:alpha/beta fold hydrolase [Paracraurococcus ruber]MBK1662310.1 alpha/beta hydrolase [Paracraurococcus ruber]TDG08972.1 alpha/beta fold hydrolase [Paracraurococcus ruber]